MTEILYVPDRERVATTNAWAFLHWLRTVGNIDLPGWHSLQRWSATAPASFAAAVADFSNLGTAPVQLIRHAGSHEAVAWRGDGTTRVAVTRQDPGGLSEKLPEEIAAALTRTWPPGTLIRSLAEVLLHADLRPDDRVLVNGPAWPWLAGLLEGATIILAEAGELLGAVEQEAATVLVAPARVLSQLAFRKTSHRPDLAALRTIIATGGPLSAEGRRRVYTWIKADLLLLARSGDTLWGNPLDPVLAQPPATPALFMPPRAVPGRRQSAPPSWNGSPPPSPRAR